MMMFSISAIQTISFVLVGNSVLGIKGMTFQYWLVLFTTSCAANLIGLNISSAFNSVITIYILIPFIIIPQLLFSGVLVRYDRLHISDKSSREYVPLIGEVMTARWSYEALAVEQFKNNRYEKRLFPYFVEISQCQWYASYLTKALDADILECQKAKSVNDTVRYNIRKLDIYITEMSDEAGYKVPGNLATAFKEGRMDSAIEKDTKTYLTFLSSFFGNKGRQVAKLKDLAYPDVEKNENESKKFARLKTDYYNKGLATFVLNEDVLEKYIEKPKRIIRKFEPGYMVPTANNGRAHFYAPFKIIGNFEIDTFWFNLMVIWTVSILLYIALYFNIFRKLVSGFEGIRKKRSDSSFLIIKEISSW
jgi:hypothetical protein